MSQDASNSNIQSAIDSVIKSVSVDVYAYLNRHKGEKEVQDLNLNTTKKPSTKVQEAVTESKLGVKDNTLESLVEDKTTLAAEDDVKDEKPKQLPEETQDNIPEAASESEPVAEKVGKELKDAVVEEKAVPSDVGISENDVELGANAVQEKRALVEQVKEDVPTIPPVSESRGVSDASTTDAVLTHTQNLAQTVKSAVVPAQDEKAATLTDIKNEAAKLSSSVIGLVAAGAGIVGLPGASTGADGNTTNDVEAQKDTTTATTMTKAKDTLNDTVEETKKQAPEIQRTIDTKVEDAKASIKGTAGAITETMSATVEQAKKKAPEIQQSIDNTVKDNVKAANDVVNYTVQEANAQAPIIQRDISDTKDRVLVGAESVKNAAVDGLQEGVKGEDDNQSSSELPAPTDADSTRPKGAAPKSAGKNDGKCLLM